MNSTNERYVASKKQTAGAKAAVKAIFSDRKSTEVALASREKRNRELLARERSVDPSPGKTRESERTIRTQAKRFRASTVIEAMACEGRAILQMRCSVCGADDSIKDFASARSKITTIDPNAPAPFAFLCQKCSEAFESKKE